MGNSFDALNSYSHVVRAVAASRRSELLARHGRATLLLLCAFAPLTLAACGAGGAGAAVRPKETSAAEGLGETACREADNSGEPLVVDWKPDQRAELELMMKENVAIVSYSCKGFKLLKDCKVDGKYGFLGMSKKEQVVRLSNADEVKANLPFGGAGIAGSISGEMNRGSTLDVAMVMIGKVKTTWAKVQADELQGDCAGATHFVKGAMIGAFVMETGTKGEVKSAAQMFGAGASGQSASQKGVKNKDGELADCAKSSPDDKTAPGQCQAFIRLELKAILPKAVAGAPPAPVEARTRADVVAPDGACPKGLVLSDGKCTDAAHATAYVCDGKDSSVCVAQCDKGNFASCGLAGASFVAGTSGAARDEKRARDLFTKGCDGGDTKSCANLGVLLLGGRGGNKDGAAAAQRFAKACDGADALACASLGAQYRTGDGVAKDETKAAALLQKGCQGGDDLACASAGKLLLDGVGVTKDVVKGTDFLKRACDGTQAQACVDLGLASELGKDAPKDAIRAKMLYQRGCYRGNMQACFAQGRLDVGFGGNPAMAKQAFEMGCARNDTLSCAALKVLYGGTRAVVPGPESVDLMNRCNSGGSARDCANAGVLNMAAGLPIGKQLVERACMQQDPLGCAVKNKKP